MLDKIQKWDLWILDSIYQRLYMWIWKNWGISNFNLSRLCLCLGSSLRFLATKHDFLNISGIGILFIFGMLLIQNIEYNSRPNKINVVRYTFVWYRLFLISIIIITLFNPIPVMILTSYAYFFSCQQLPPMKKKEYRKLSYVGA